MENELIDYYLAKILGSQKCIIIFLKTKEVFGQTFGRKEMFWGSSRSLKTMVQW